MIDPINIPCPNCKSPAGDVCRTKGGKHRNDTCPQRLARAEVMAEARPATKPSPAPVPQPAPRPDPFDERTPPPRVRPKGLSLDAHITLPPGEDLAGIFAQWSRDGRVPETAVLAEYIGRAPLGSGADSGYTFVAGANPFGVRAGDEIPAGPSEPYLVRVTVKRQQCPKCWAIFTPKDEA